MLKKNIKNFEISTNLKQWGIVGILFVICLFISKYMNISEYTCDSDYYWTIADGVLENGWFYLQNYPETFRGCIFPLILLMFKHIFGGIWGWRVLSSIMVACIWGKILPDVFANQVNGKIQYWVRFVFAFGAFIYVWGNFIQYPLSDMPACFFFLTSIYLFKISYHAERQSFRAFLNILGGGCLYISYNCRAAYLYAIVAVIIVVFYKTIRRNIIQGCVTIGATIIGLMLVAIPQSVVNYSNIGTIIPKVYTEQHTGYTTNLELEQVAWGVTHPRYETYIGDSTYYSNPAVYFNDLVGWEIASREGIEDSNFSYLDFIKIFLKYPMDMIGIYSRHLISGCIPAFTEIYITDIYKDKTLLLLMYVLIWIIVSLSLLVSNRENLVKKISLYDLALVPAILQLFGAVELRFFFGVHIFVYAYVFWGIDYSELWRKVRERWQISLAFSILLAMLIIIGYGNILSNNSEVVMLINDYYISR